MRPLSEYRAILFDCDGVLLDSNAVKTEAFRKVASRFGEEPAQRLVAYHVANGGVSRHAKFRYLFDSILGRAPLARELEACIDGFAEAVQCGLAECRVADGLDELRDLTPHANWMVVSGGDQAELRALFAMRSLASFFDAGIFGSPTPKREILQLLVSDGSVRMPALMIGDSRLDHEVAAESDIDFVFASDWSEFAGWEKYCREHGIPTVPSIKCLVQSMSARS